MFAKSIYRTLILAMFACALLAFTFFVTESDVSAEENPRVSADCLDCHEGLMLTGSAHELWEGAMDGPEAHIACTDCHMGDARHYEEDPEEYPMTNPSDLNAGMEANLCASCHMNPHQQNMLEKNIHMINEVSCSGCHSMHGNTHAGLLKAEEPGLCLDCHTSVEGEFARPYRHPVNDGIVACSECHMTLDETTRELSYNGTNVCMECHAEFQGPFPYEHPATLDYSTEEGGCLTCHDPHGSFLPRMLTQPYEAPHFQLCSQCHAVPGHNMNSVHGTAWAGVPCSDCHTDIHGSYVSRLFLSETLEGEGCFNVGCHKF
ncbi:MAG: hypothetical protein HKN20_15370 [Gemmatimonadetes bacterium]|nr:hypothetical protein [Gemmatimonadota bacterium]